jgi:UDP-N-acetylmuramoylalanine-D-glutamate ligase
MSHLSLTLTQRRRLAPLAQRRILILGASREGLSTYQFLRAQFPHLLLTIADARPLNQFTDSWSSLLSTDPHLVGIFGAHYLNSLTRFQLCFLTPGIPPHLPAIQTARDSGVVFTSNIEWFFRLARGTIIGVTGTK